MATRPAPQKRMRHRNAQGKVALRHWERGRKQGSTPSDMSAGDHAKWGGRVLSKASRYPKTGPKSGSDKESPSLAPTPKMRSQRHAAWLSCPSKRRKERRAQKPRMLRTHASNMKLLPAGAVASWRVRTLRRGLLCWWILNQNDTSSCVRAPVVRISPAEQAPEPRRRKTWCNLYWHMQLPLQCVRRCRYSTHGYHCSTAVSRRFPSHRRMSIH